MKKVFLFVLLLVMGFAPAVFAEQGRSSSVVVSDTASSNFSSQRDDDYWTRVWYEKQARKGKFYKHHVYKKKRSHYKRSSVRREQSSIRGGRIFAKVDLSSQRMKVFRNGVLLHSWKVSTGRNGYRTPTGTWNIHRMHREYYSKKYDNAPMPHAMFFHRGFAVHGTGSINRLGRTASHGCVRLHPDNAAQLFSMVKRFGGTVKVSH